MKFWKLHNISSGKGTVKLIFPDDGTIPTNLLPNDIFDTSSTDVVVKAQSPLFTSEKRLDSSPPLV